MVHALILALLAPSAAADDRASCPLVLPRSTVEVKAPPGWVGYSPSIMRLTGYGMMGGPPESMTYLVPSSSKNAKGDAVNTWAFAAGEEKWLYCTYDDSSAIQISTRMADWATECSLTHQRASLGSITRMEAKCRAKPSTTPPSSR